MRPEPPIVRVRVRTVRTYGLPGWVDAVLLAWWLTLALLPFGILGWALWETFV